MAVLLEVGTAHARPGKISYGTYEGVALPSGGYDALPVIIARGVEDGPTLWVTAGIHGPEYTGISVIHRLITPDLVRSLHGTLVALPTLNPAGLRTGSRTAYYASNVDPNRLFPVRGAASGPETSPLNPLEAVYKRLFETLSESASFLIDLHNFSPGSLPFALRDPIFYRDGRDRVAAQRLQTRIGEMLAVFGHTIVNEFVSTDYLRKALHRSVSGAALNSARIPAFTVELGGYMSVDPAIVNAAVVGIRNVMRWGGMLTDEPEAITDIRVLNPAYPIRRMQHPFAPAAGIVQYLVKVGETLINGDTVARLTDIYGRPLGKNDGCIVTDYDGYVLGLSIGAVCYQNDSLLSLAVRDESDLILPYPT